MWDELRELGDALRRRSRDLRALVVIGEGRAFSSGIDTTRVHRPDGERRRPRWRRRARPRTTTRWSTSILARAGGLHLARGGPVRDDRRGARATRSAPGCSSRSRATCASSPAGTQARAARVQVRDHPRPRRHAAPAAPRRRGQGEGADLHRGARSTPTRRCASGSCEQRRRRRRARGRRPMSSPSAIAAQPPLAVRGAEARGQRGARRSRRPRRAPGRGRGPGRRACAPTT